MPLTRHLLDFDLPVTASSQSAQRHPDKAKLRAEILAMHSGGMSYRQIAQIIGLHFTRVRQIVKASS